MKHNSCPVTLIIIVFELCLHHNVAAFHSTSIQNNDHSPWIVSKARYIPLVPTKPQLLQRSTRQETWLFSSALTTLEEQQKQDSPQKERYDDDDDELSSSSSTARATTSTRSRATGSSREMKTTNYNDYDNRFNEKLRELVDTFQLQEAMDVLEKEEERLQQQRHKQKQQEKSFSSSSSTTTDLFSSQPHNNSQSVNELSYLIILRKLGRRNYPHERAAQTAEKVFQRLQRHRSHDMTHRSYSALMSVWAATGDRNAGPRSSKLLQDFWDRYNNHHHQHNHIHPNRECRPSRGTYLAAMTAWSRSRRGHEGAKKAEELMEEMEALRVLYPDLTPNTLCVNIVLNAWSYVWAHGAARHAETILNRMEKLAYVEGRIEMQPNTTSYNTVISTFARSWNQGSARKAEELLLKMETRANEHNQQQQQQRQSHHYNNPQHHPSDNNKAFRMKPNWCNPDHLSFNSVINAWARSKESGGASRAEAILRHMQRRYQAGDTDVRPDTATYTTVLNAWGKSRSKEALSRASKLLDEMEEEYQNGNVHVRPNALSYNTIINVWSKSQDPYAADRALEIFHHMKRLSTREEEDRTDCTPDVFTYTSLIDTLAKQDSEGAAEKAISLLEEIEALYQQTHNRSVKPNIRAYTAVINAIARSRRGPERAEAIVQRILAAYDSGGGDESAVVPMDIICYNALLNAYGWSNEKGKAGKCYDIYKDMIHRYERDQDEAVKPDIISCNSVLNACAFDEANTESERAKIVTIAVQLLENTHNSAPEFGKPNPTSFAYAISSIAKHMPARNARRTDLAKAMFWRCCKSGCVTRFVLTQLYQAVPWEECAELLGPALLSEKHERKPMFSMEWIPKDWTRNSRNGKERSRRQYGGEVTKSSLKVQKWATE